MAITSILPVCDNVCKYQSQRMLYFFLDFKSSNMKVKKYLHMHKAVDLKKLNYKTLNNMCTKLKIEAVIELL